MLLHRYNEPMRIGSHLIDPPVVLAPMAGVTDKPFRQLCKRLGAGLAVSEMTTADPRLWSTADAAALLPRRVRLEPTGRSRRRVAEW